MPWGPALVIRDRQLIHLCSAPLLWINSLPPKPLKTGFLCSPGCPRTCSVEQADLKLTDICLRLPPEYWDFWPFLRPIEAS